MKTKRKKKTTLMQSIEIFRLQHRTLTSIIGIIGVILIWRGVWTLFDTTPLLSSPWGSIVLGLLFVVSAGVFYKLI